PAPVRQLYLIDRMSLVSRVWRARRPMALQSPMRAARSTIDLDCPGAWPSTPQGRRANSLGETLMGFWNGRVTFTRYRVGGEHPVRLDERLLEQARAHLIGRHVTPEPVDGVTTGWAGGE